MPPSPSFNSHRLPIAPGEHILSAWIRLNLRSGFGHLPFYRVLRYWGLAKRQIRAQRVDESLLDSIAAHIGDVDTRVLSREYAVDDLWSLSLAMDIRPERPTAIGPANTEHRALAFDTGWKLCPECVSDDKARTGYSYWHIEHQLPSVVHCSIHGNSLRSTLSLGHLDSLTLPEHWVDSCPIPRKTSVELQEWSRFVVKVHKIVSKSPQIASIWRKQIPSILSLPDPLRPGHRRLFDPISKTFEAQVGRTVLEHLFKAYRGNWARRPLILWASLFDQAETIRHPVYWLVILFWLRADIFPDPDYENCLPLPAEV